MDPSCCGGKTVLLMACSGGSNVGQLSNEVARQLTLDGNGAMFCLAGVGGQVEGIICSVACAKKCMDLAGCTDYTWVDLTEAGIEKNSNLELQPEQIAVARAAVEAVL